MEGLESVGLNREIARLDEIFTRCLEVAGRGGRSASYLPLLDYADGLAAFGRPEAREYYRRAYDLHVNEEGLNKYVFYLGVVASVARATWENTLAD
jgi:hypothetical protein